MKRVRLIVLVLVLLLAIAVPAAFAQDAAPDLIMFSFDKTASAEGVWDGAVTGDVVGSLHSELKDLRMVGPLWFIEVEWTVTGDESLTITTTGTLNTLTGVVVTTGEVTEGAYAGATVYEQGQLIDPATGRFAGTFLLVSAAS